MPDGTQGGYANSAGRTLENTIIGTLQSKGFVCVPYREYTNYVRRHGQVEANQRYGTELLLRNVPYTTIYGHQGKTEFLLLSARYDLRIRIECKWQQSAGSVDEKFPYLYLNCLEAMPEDHIIVVLDGGGAKREAVEWLMRAVAEKRYATEENKKKLIEVFNLAEFLAWANRVFR